MSNETIVAVFETSAHADRAVRALESAGVPSSAIELHTKETEPSNRTKSAAQSSGPPSTGFFFWDAMFGALAPHQDRPAFESSIDRGETLLAVTVAEQDADRVMAVLEEQAPLDLDEPTAKHDRQREEVQRPQESGPAETDRNQRSPRRAARETTESEEVIPLAEEELQIGKRTVNRGTTRLRRYVIETPVEQQVSLRDQRVIVERRKPVTDKVTGDELTEKTVEVSETSEVPVTEKVARLKEEVVIRREDTERTETVRDAVRRDEIAVEDATETAPPRRKSRQ